jgi:hypothetical protein
MTSASFQTSVAPYAVFPSRINCSTNDDPAGLCALHKTGLQIAGGDLSDLLSASGWRKVRRRIISQSPSE